MKSFLQRYPVTIYFILAFLISWGIGFAAVGPKFLRGEVLGFNDALVLFLPTLAGPSIVGVLMAYLTDGRAGIRELFARMRLWRVSGKWYAATFIFPAGILLVLGVLTMLASRDFTPTFFVMGILIGFLAGYFEEIGWMGFAYPRMVKKQSSLTAGIYLGIVWGIWHLFADYLGASGVRGAFWLPRFVAFVVFVTALRVIIVWVYENTQSVWLSQLMHASSTGFLAILVPLSISPAQDTLFHVIYAALLWLLVVMLLNKYGRSLSSSTV
ncbi:MAG: CPBP family intramembrane metalloprotease [Chloroflexi bacterium]|nr:MAG: CPBP family intramembrane metalloprotease [Chloroflexota bacterium]MBL1197316.1 CPBP family intramembrane metalloprotease [Chloroflexota bacterium]NOH14612.1 CPBP family intramembrane metalloprotease [Chloroflexota bacterium]